MIDHLTQDLQRQLRDRGGSQELDCAEQAEGSSCLGQHVRSGPVCSGGRGGGRGVRTPLRSWAHLCRGVCCIPCWLSLYVPCKPLATICATSQIACCLSSHWGVSSACWEARSGRLALAPCSALFLCGPRSCLCPSPPLGLACCTQPCGFICGWEKGWPLKALLKRSPSRGVHREWPCQPPAQSFCSWLPPLCVTSLKSDPEQNHGQGYRSGVSTHQRSLLRGSQPHRHRGGAGCRGSAGMRARGRRMGRALS